MKKYIFLIFISIIVSQSYCQTDDPDPEIFIYTETLPKCKGGIKNINKVFNDKFSIENGELMILKSLKILIDIDGNVSVIETKPELNSDLSQSIENLLDSIEWVPAYHRQLAVKFQAILGFKISKKKFIIENTIPNELKDASPSSQYVPNCLIEAF